MDIFDLENDLPDEIMASTSQPSSVTRNNFRVIPRSDGSNRLVLRVEPLSSTSGSTESNSSVPVTSSLQTATNYTPSFSPQSALNLSMPPTISTQTAATSSSNFLPQTQLQNMQSYYTPTPSTPGQAPVMPWYLHNMISRPNSQSIYSTTSSQPVDMSSSSFLSQSQTNHYVHPSTSSLSADVSSSSFLHQSSNNQSVYPSTSSQSMCMPSTSFLNHPRNQFAYTFLPRATTNPSASSQPLSLNSLTTSRSSNPSFSPFVSNIVSNCVPSTPRYIPPISSTQNNPQYPSVTVASSNQHKTMERKIADMKKRWLGDHGRQTQIDTQSTSSVTQVQPTASSASPQSVSQNVQAIVTGLKNLENTVTKTTAVSETPFGQQSENRENQNAMNLVEDPTFIPLIASSSNKNLTANTPQNITKEWQKQINIELREHLVGNIVQTMFPNTVLPPPVMQSLKSYIEKMEREVYESANSKNEYYLLLAEKSYKIQKEINKKRQERKEQQLLLQQQQQQQQTQQAQNSQQDFEMSTVQPNETATSLDSNSNMAENQSSITTSGASHILSLVNNVSSNKQKNFTKEWHKKMCAELREILVKKFVQKMLLVSGSEAVINNSEESSSTIKERISSYAKNVECDVYQKADSRIKYYELLADKYCKMEEELSKGNFAALDNS